MSQWILARISRWLFPAEIDVEKRLASMTDRDPDRERSIARQISGQIALSRTSNRRRASPISGATPPTR
jgi:hypothetical protein